MNNQEGSSSNPQRTFKRRPVVMASLGFVFSAILGLMIGASMGHAALGLIFGAIIGLMMGAALDRQQRKESKGSEQ